MTTKNLLLVALISTLSIFCGTDKNYIPDELLGLKLERKLVGEEAKKFVDRLHFQDVAAEKNEIGFYRGDVGSAIIYITYYADSETARTEGEKMNIKISPQNSVFRDKKKNKIEGLEIYSYSGMGQTHYVFDYEKNLYWLSADPFFSEEFLLKYLEHIE